MKAHQRKIFNRLKTALTEGRKKGYLPTQSRIYGKGFAPDGYDLKAVEYACAYGAMCIGLGIDVSSNKFDKTLKPMADALGVETDCISHIYGSIWRANDNAIDTHESDADALKYLEKYLNDNPEVC